ncbi:MAG: helix-turn-helix domain-containing protein [Oscillospiraceae bacterium]|jgi:putative transcriptional regulator|nr:helix-turn-helix domain-containing protein [Oscillospiraceae bacterium]
MSKMGTELIGALQEVADHVEGRKKLRQTYVEFTPVRERYTPEEIKMIRSGLGMTQSVFADVIGVSKRTVESWETGRFSPDGAARRLISVLQQDPQFPERYHIMIRPHA